MENNVLQHYKVEKDAVQTSYHEQMMLKINPQYEEWANSTASKLIEYFLNKYDGVSIEIPKLREKSPRSLLGKIKNLQVERLSKLYSIDEATMENKKELYLLLKERIEENEELDEDKMLEGIKSLLKNDDININSFEETLMVDGLSNSSKTALLRILVSNVKKSNDLDKDEKLKYLSDKYGKGLARKTGEPEDDLIRYDSIINIRNNQRKIERLKDERQFLKANDLRGMKIVVSKIPDDFKTDNIKIKQILKRRSNTENNQEERKLNHLAIVELGKEFYSDIENNEQLLENANMEIIPDSNKHRKKRNGYEAEHIKFINKDYPEFTLEMQFKSVYVENITRGNGSASHENRPGKSREIPYTENDQELIKAIDYMTPRYTTFNMEDGYIIPNKQPMLRNVIAYFQDQLDVGSEEYQRIVRLYSEIENKKQNTELIK